MHEKDYSDFINSPEIIEPETIRHLFPSISDEDCEKLMAFIVLYKNRYFWENFHIFEKLVLALNDVKPDFATMQGCSPEQIWYALDIAHNLFPTREFAPEILKYIEFMSNKVGVYIYPQYLQEIDNRYYDKAVQLATKGPFPIGDDSPEEIQAAKYLEIMAYVKTKN
jgi:hypothetical protein